MEEPPPIPRMLDELEMTAWLQIVRLVAQLEGSIEDQLRRDAGLSHFEYGVMARLSGAPDCKLRMTKLAVLANGSISRLSHTVTRLEKRGWVRRDADCTNGRFTNVTLTESGFKKVSRSAPGHITLVRELVVDVFSREQLEQLTELCRLMLSACQLRLNCEQPVPVEK